MKANLIFMKHYSTAVAPSATAALIYEFVRSIKFDSPFRLAFGYSIDGKKSAISSISCLFGPSSPANVSSFIVAVYVNAVKAVFFGWLSANLPKKILIGRKTEFNPTATVMGKSRISGVLASRFSKAIRFVLRGGLAFAVCCKVSFHHVFMKTATGQGVSIPDMSAGGSKHIATIALTEPTEFADIPHNHHSAISIPKNVNEFTVSGNRNDSWLGLQNCGAHIMGVWGNTKIQYFINKRVTYRK
jgi:hypothetical protein